LIANAASYKRRIIDTFNLDCNDSGVRSTVAVINSSKKSPSGRDANTPPVSYSKLPFKFNVRLAPDGNPIKLPTFAALPLTCETVNTSPSISKSTPLPLSTNTFSRSSSSFWSVKKKSSTATGASLTPVMVTVAVAVSVPPLPSSIV